MLDAKPVRHDRVLAEKKPGIVTGLAWTAAGGEILFIETLFTKGNGKFTVTGQLGDVMKESVQIAVSLVKSMFPDKASLFEENDLHIHVPEGAVPKDGPSAGVTMLTSLVSVLTGRAVRLLRSPRSSMWIYGCNASAPMSSAICRHSDTLPARTPTCREGSIFFSIAHDSGLNEE